MKRKIFITLIGVLVLITLAVCFSQKTFAAPGAASRYEPCDEGRIVCHCTAFGRCKARGAGNNCAQSSPGGNIQCSEYNGNCLLSF